MNKKPIIAALCCLATLAFVTPQPAMSADPVALKEQTTSENPPLVSEISAEQLAAMVTALNVSFPEGVSQADVLARIHSVRIYKTQGGKFELRVVLSPKPKNQ